jgi:hypothetical protein
LYSNGSHIESTPAHVNYENIPIFLHLVFMVYSESNRLWFLNCAYSFYPGLFAWAQSCCYLRFAKVSRNSNNDLVDFCDS